MKIAYIYMGLEKKVTLNARMLQFNVAPETSDASEKISYASAVDGQMGQESTDCANSAQAPSNIKFLWLTINLGDLYSVSNVKMLSREEFGTESEIYVGKSAIQADGSVDPSKDYKCGDKYPIGNASKNFTDFPCSSVHWVQYVTIHRPVTTSPHKHLHVCEVEVYYNENEGTVNV